MAANTHHTDDTTPQAKRLAVRPAIRAVFPWVLGIAAGLTWRFSPGAVAPALGFLAVGAAFLSWRGHRRAAYAALILVVATLGILRTGLWRNSQPNAALLAPLLDTRVWIVGTVASDPQIAGRRWRFGVSAESIQADSLVAEGRMPLFVRMDTAVGAVRVGERVRLGGMLRGLPRATTPGIFDYGAFLEWRGYTAILSVNERGGLAILPAGRSVWARSFDAARRYVQGAITYGMGAEESGLIKGLVIGDRAGLSQEVLDQFQACGVFHVLSVSGLHVGIVLLGVGWPLRRIFGRRAWQAALLIALVWAYAALTGNDPPVVRAAIMASVFLLASLIERRPDRWNALALSALVTLLVSPTALFDIGFQLSYAAMIGILWLADVLTGHAARLRFSARNTVGQFVAGLLVVTVAANVTTWPLVAHYFARVPLVALFSNVLIGALVTFAVWGAMASVLFGWWPALVKLINVPISWLLKATLLTGEYGASLPGAALWVRPPGWVEIGAYTIILWVVWQVATRRGVLQAAIAAVLLVASLWVWSAYAYRRTGVECVFLDVGQGDAALCTFPNGATMLVDGGAASPWFDAGDWTVIPYLRSQGITRVDVVLATHSDNDHIGGLASVVGSMDVGEIWYNGRNDTSFSFRALMNAARRRGVPVRAAMAGDSAVGFGDGVRALVLAPPQDSLAFTFWSDNDLSVVLWMEAYGRSVLFTGDAGFRAENRLLETAHERLRADVLKVAHHGSKYSTADTFLAMVAPHRAVLSVGRMNRFGHPAPEVLDRLTAHQVGVLRTDRDGTVTWCVRPDTVYWRITADSN